MGHPEHGWANQPDGPSDGKASVGVDTAFRTLLNTYNFDDHFRNVGKRCENNFPYISLPPDAGPGV